MKTTNIKNTVLSAAFALAAIASVNGAQAAAPRNNEPVEIKYLGAVGNKPIFQVAFDNAAAEDLIVTLKDADGNTLYTERFNDTKFNKRFQLERTDENLQVTLSVTNRKDRKTQQFQISRNTRVVEDVTVTKL